MFNITHGKHISIWELREVQENHAGKILLSLMLRAQVVLFSVLSLCLPCKHCFTSVNQTPDRKYPLLRVATEGGGGRINWCKVPWFHASSCSWDSMPQLRICLLNWAFKELLILKVLFEHQLISSHKVPLKGRRLRYPQFIDWRNESLDSVKGTQQRSALGSVWLLGSRLYYRILPVLMQNVFKSILKKWKRAVSRGKSIFLSSSAEIFMCKIALNSIR